MKKTPEQELKEHCEWIIRERQQWRRINEYGCNDPFWSDGCNMNLTRNHILHHRIEIEKICTEQRWNLPEEYYLPVPPEVDKSYMAKEGKYREVREKRIRETGEKTTYKKEELDDYQLRFA